ncbi:MAG: hypothetical protein AUG49_00170 [Catenulispora sp. 13_1_20CM_3_70_7]|nr:MAG: hypothetical protein AUG49_00170 [Catenulispora sp. 13_1_20CM_3_70_7]
MRSVDPIPDGYYIFVVTEWYEFRYRDMSDRAEGEELYVRHSMLGSGGCARAAGMMAVFGEEIFMTDSSGHYTPTLPIVRKFAVPLLRAAGYSHYEFTDAVHDWTGKTGLKKLMADFRRRTEMG